MATVCPDNPLGLCPKCKDLEPYMVFRDNPKCEKSGEEDKCCGYFWFKSGLKVNFPYPKTETSCSQH